MTEAEVESPEDAAFFVANDVVNEHHAFPVVQRADIGGPNVLYINLNGEWYSVYFSKVYGTQMLERLERLASHER